MTGKLCTFSTFEFWRLRTNSRTARRQFSTGVNSVPGFSKNHTVTNAIFVDADCSASERSPARREKFGVTQIRQTLNGEEYPYRTLQLTGGEAYEDLLGYDRFLQAMGAYNEDKMPMLLPGDWGQGKSCTLFMFNNLPSGKADDPQYRNPRQSGNVRLIIRDFKIGHYGRLGRLDRCHVTQKTRDLLPSSFWDGMFSPGFSS